MIRVAIFLLILLLGLPIIWAFIRHAQKYERISFFGFNPTSKNENPKKFERTVRSYRMQMFLLPIIALFVAIFVELPN